MKQLWKVCSIALSCIYVVGCNGEEFVSSSQASVTTSTTTSSSDDEPTSTDAQVPTTSNTSLESTTGTMTSEMSNESTTEEPIPPDSCIPEKHQKYNDVGEGTLARPYLICSAAQLVSMRVIDPIDVAAVYSLVADIDLQPYYEQGGSPFQIAQTGLSYAFIGEFYGNHHRILNFKFANLNGSGGGLFSYVADGFKIVDLQLENFSVDSQSDAGLLIDNIAMDEDPFHIENIQIRHSKINGSHRIGGAIGSLIAIKDKIDGSQSILKNIHIENIQIEMAHYNLQLTGFGSLGGLVGMVGASINSEFVSNLAIEDSHVSGKMTVSPKAEQFDELQEYPVFAGIGGIVGDGSHLDLKNTDVSIEFEFKGDYVIVDVGGLIGRLSLSSHVENSLNNKIKFMSWYGTSISHFGGLIGQLSKQSQLKNVSLVDSKIQAYVATHCGGLVGLSTDSSVEASSVTASVLQCGKFAGGLVGTAEHSTIEGSFSQNSTLDFNSLTSANGGLVGQLKEQSVLSRSFAQDEVTSAIFFGGLVGACITGSRIENSYARLKANILSGDWIAGMVYSADDCSIENTYVAGSITKINWFEYIADNVSGFVGLATNLTINNSWSNVSFKGNQYNFYFLGGFVSDMVIPMTVSLADIYWVQDPMYPKIQCMSALLQEQKNVQEPVSCMLVTDEDLKDPAHQVYQTWDPMIWTFVPGDFPILQ